MNKDVLELFLLDQLKSEVKSAKQANDNTAKAKAEVEKILKDVVTARAELVDEIRRVKDKLANLNTSLRRW